MSNKQQWTNSGRVLSPLILLYWSHVKNGRQNPAYSGHYNFWELSAEDHV